MTDEKDNYQSNDSSEVTPLSRKLPAGRGVGAEVDINCDMGEGVGNDEAIMPFISSANIACGYHAGDVKTIWQTIELAIKYKIYIGAHPSFHDKKNFGRKEINLSPEEVYELVTQQLLLFNEIAVSADVSMHHIKPHGALYNMSVKDVSIARAIARAVKDFDQKLVLFGLSGSHSISEAKAVGLKTAREAFADRSYQDDGSLTPRSQPGALIGDTGKVVQQVLQMIKQGTVTTVSGKIIPIVAETICIHGDGEHAVEFAKAIHDALHKKK